MNITPPATYSAGQTHRHQAGEGRHALLCSSVSGRWSIQTTRADVKQGRTRFRTAIKVDQPGGPGKFEVPKWDPVSQKKVRDALIVLGTTLTDTSRAFGTRDQVDPMPAPDFGTATTWGGNPRQGCDLSQLHAGQK